jgi:glycosyltransferase involved in cell wall biosynthesis
MQATPLLSVVVATYNRAETIRETIRHLADQTLPPAEYEAIFIDDGSSDNTREVVCSLIPSVPFSMKYLAHSNAGPGYTQNRGIREARADVVLLIADDILLERGALEAHLRAHRENPQREVAVLGCTMQSPKLDQSVFLRTWDPFKFRDFEGMLELPYYLFWACNMSVVREFMLEHGMFQERRGRAGAAAHEDVELGYRLSKHGLRIIYSENALGHHYHIETLAGAMKRGYERGLNFDEFRSRVPVPEVVVRYHVIGWKTLREHFETFTGPGRGNLLGADRSLTLLFARYLVRSVLFNRLTVRAIWVPFLNAAERHPFLAGLVHRNLYRGVINYEFFRGCRDADMVFGPRAESLGGS